MKFNLKAAAAAAVLAATAALPAHADTLVVNLANMAVFGDFEDPQNSNQFFTLPAGSQILDYTYSNLVVTALGVSYLSEFVLSVNNADGSEYMDMIPSLDDNPGTSPALSGSFSGAGGAGLPFDGGPFTLGAGSNNLWVTVYDVLPDAGQNAVVVTGLLTITYIAPIPEPATYGLMALGLLGVAGAARRRQAR